MLANIRLTVGSKVSAAIARVRGAREVVDVQQGARGTNCVQDVALAFEAGERGVMRRRSRPPSEPLVNASMLTQIALAGGYMGVVGFGFYHWALAGGYDETQARTGLLLLWDYRCRGTARNSDGG